MHGNSPLTWGFIDIPKSYKGGLSYLSHCVFLPLSPSLFLLFSHGFRHPVWVSPGETCSIWLCSPPNETSFMMRFISGGGMGSAWSLITSLATGSLTQAPWWRWLKTGKRCQRDSTVWAAPCRTLSKWVPWLLHVEMSQRWCHGISDSIRFPLCQGDVLELT